MPNILGQPFSRFVTEQINVRQESLGKYDDISSKDLQYYTTKAPWIRLASSVDLIMDRVSGSLKDGAAKKLIDVGIDVSNFTGEELARNVILQGGTLSATVGENEEIISNGLNSGLNDGSSIFNGAYGWGGIKERGYVPMPGITNADVQYLSNGALTKTTINIKCFSRKQFQLIDILYLRPGYTLLLEFGHSVYLDNDKKLKSFDKFSTAPLRTLLNPKGKTQYDIYREIRKARRDYHGNYDAVYGKISNFNWQFNPDGSYDCQVVLTGMGDVIESLKMNTTIDAQKVEVVKEEVIIPLLPPTENPGTPVENPIISNKSKTQLNEILYELYQRMKDTSAITSYDVSIPNFSFPSDGFKEKTLKIPNSLLAIPITNIDNEENTSPQGYMTFGTLISYIQNQFLLYSKEEDKTRTPIVSFDMDFDDLANDENYILRFPGEFSADPTICLIPYTNTAKPCPNVDLPTSVINEGVVKYSSFNVTESLYAGRLAGIYVNIGFISKTLSSLPPDEELKISILDFLKDIIKGITQSLGGFNKITIKRTIDGELQFIEDIPQSLNFNKSGEEFARFNVFGFNPGENYVEGSFIKSLNLAADLSSDFATMISIGAQSNGNQLSGNALSFSNYNLGLRDRIVPEKASYTPKLTNTSDKNEEQSITIQSNFQKIEDGTTSNLISSIYNAKNFINNDISALKSLNSTHADLIVGKISQPSEGQQIQAPFFLPFNFSLEMEGLSGMKLYQKFKISNNVLPPSYENDGVDIQIKGINHSINTTAWTTKLDTLSVPAFKTENITQHEPYPLGAPSAVIAGARGAAVALSDVEPPASLNPDSVERFEAMQESYNGVFARDGEVEGMCAQWTYNLAKNYVSFLNGGELGPKKLRAGGNANNNKRYFQNLVKLGYSQTTSVLTRDGVKNKLVTTTWGYGDVVVYYCNDGPVSQTHVQYGHTQIYVGEINSVGWSTSTANNYGTSMVYPDRKGNNWTYIVFRAPSGTSTPSFLTLPPTEPTPSIPLTP